MRNKRRAITALAIAAVGCLGVRSIEAAMVDYSVGDGGLESFNITYNTGVGQNTTINGALAGGIAITEVAGVASLPAFRPLTPRSAPILEAPCTSGYLWLRSTGLFGADRDHAELGPGRL